MLQDEIFAAGEGDRWFLRNRAALRAPAQGDPALQLLELYGLSPRRVLEIGAANGVRLAAIRERWGASCAALDVSAAALAEGRLRFPSLGFVRGEAAALPLAGPFDLVIVNFVFHWIDRRNLLRAAAEIDRVLGDGGFLFIGDFFPASPVRVRYHHLSEREIFTFKQDYAALFVASGLYRLVAMLTGEHGGKRAAGAGEESRTAAWLLRKETAEGYVAPARQS